MNAPWTQDLLAAAVFALASDPPALLALAWSLAWAGQKAKSDYVQGARDLALHEKEVVR